MNRPEMISIPGSGKRAFGLLVSGARRKSRPGRAILEEEAVTGGDGISFGLLT